MLVSRMAEIMPGRLDYSVECDREIRGAFLDSRIAEEGRVFFAARGENLDGNAFAADALKAGAALAVMSDPEIYRSVRGNKILVEDAVESMKELGRLRFAETPAYKIAVTGSFGKTGVKEMLKKVLGTSFRVYATEGNKNNELGVALTGCGIDDSCDVVVTEMGSNAPGEIAVLTDMVKPDMAMVTSVGHAHIGRFATLEAIVKEKLSVACGLKNSRGVLVLPEGLEDRVPRGDYKIISFGKSECAGYRMTSMKRDGLCIRFTVNGRPQEYVVRHPYSHTAEEALAVIAAADENGIEEEKIACGLEGYSPVEGHGNIIKAGRLTVINDTYNAGFQSMLRAAESLSQLRISPKYAVFGEMGEIEGFEKDFYDKIAGLSSEYSNITFYLCGVLYGGFENTRNRWVFTDRNAALAAASEIREGIVVVKASRSRRFEDFVEALVGNAGGGNAL